MMCDHLCRVFEELELWNSLITCYTMMDKKLQATELIRKRLEVCPLSGTLAVPTPGLSIAFLCWYLPLPDVHACPAPLPIHKP